MHCSTGRLQNLHTSRRLRRLPLLIVAALLYLLAPTPPSALAALAAPSVPGDNGDVKIHAVGTSFVDHRNQPHVCQFYLDAFNFDANQQVSWTIAQQPPTGHKHALSGTLILDASGAGKSSVMSLPAGHYKLTWTFAGEKGRAKFKVFWSDCSGVPSPSPSSSGSSGGSTGGGVGPGGKIIGPGGVPVLAQTGGSTAPWVISAAALAAAGIGLVGFARRAARGH